MKPEMLVLAMALSVNLVQAQPTATESKHEVLPEGLQHGALIASAGLEEIAEDRGLGLDKVGAVLLLWNYPACDIYNDIHESGADIDMSERKKERLQEKCRKVIVLKPASRIAYFEAARAAKNIHVSAISLAWAELVAGQQNIQIIVVDDKNSCSIKTHGYTEFLEGDAKFICNETPWDLEASTMGGL